MRSNQTFTVDDVWKVPKPTVRSVAKQLVASVRLAADSSRNDLTRIFVMQLAGSVSIGALLWSGQSILSTLENDEPLARSMLIVALGAAAVVACNAPLATEFERVLAEEVERETTSRILRVTVDADLIEFDDPSFHDRVDRAKRNVAVRSWQLVRGLLAISQSILYALALVLTLARIDPLLVATLLVIGPPIVFVARRNSTAAFRFDYETTPMNRERLYLLDALSRRQEAAEVRLFRAAAPFEQRFQLLSSQRINRLRLAARERSTNILLVAGLASVSFFLSLIGLLWLHSQGRVTTAEGTIAAVALQQMLVRSRSFFTGLSAVSECSLFLKDAADFLDRDSGSPTDSHSDVSGVMPFSGMRLEDVSFQYPSSSRETIDRVSLELKPGEITALVGVNGAGKSTLAAVISGLYEPQSGSITDLDGKSLSPAGRRSFASMLMQDSTQFQLSAGENVTLDLEGGDDARLTEAVGLAGADSIVASLANGLNTRLGPEFLGGTDLSIGQWQRIALARAFYRDAPLLILDEPSAPLDALAEQDLFNGLRALAAGRCVVIISHRLSTIKDADQIVVLDAGKVVQSGSHEELLAESDSVYRRLYKAQQQTLG